MQFSSTQSPNTQFSDPQSPSTQFYQWRGYRCAYEVWPAEQGDQAQPAYPAHPALLLLHPIGVGLSRRFWDRFIQAWRAEHPQSTIYNPDLLGCGESEMPHLAYYPEDWAEQLLYLINTVVQRPVILVAQGALFPVAVEMVANPALSRSDLIQKLVLSGPPAWPVVTQATLTWQQNLSWNLFDSPLGRGFYQYAKRRQFIQRFSIRQLFAEAEAVDSEWLDRLAGDAQVQASRYAVFSFLAGFWRKDYQQMMSQLNLPTLVVLGNTASSISRSGKAETPAQRLTDYLQHLPQGQGVQIAGRNVLPYESTEAFVEAIAGFVKE